MIYTASRGHSKAGLRSHGFTIVELIVVIVVIGILAAITIVSYGAVTENARKQSASTDAQGVAAALTKYKSEKGKYPSDISELAWSPEGDSTYQYAYDVTNDTYCVTASVKGASAYVASGDSTVRDGGCAGHGVNGEVPITNLVKNPAAGTFTTGWSVGITGGVGSGARVASGGPSGVVNTFYRLSTTTAATGSPISLIAVPSGVNAIPVEGSTEYTYSVYMRSSCVVSAGFRIDRVYYTSTGASSGTLGGPIFKNTANEWHRMSLSFTTNSDTAYVRLSFAYSGPQVCPAVSTFDATGVMLVKGDRLYEFADGNSANWVWNGTPNNSSSTGPGI